MSLSRVKKEEAVPDKCASSSASSLASSSVVAGRSKVYDEVARLESATIVTSSSATSDSGYGSASSGVKAKIEEPSDDNSVSEHTIAPEPEPEPESEPRRSGRKRKPTTMMIDGNVVLKKNNYVLNGHEYIFGAFEADEVKNKKSSRIPSTGSKAKKGGRKNVYMDHNEVVKGRIVQDKEQRWEFIAAAYNTLEPFLDEKVKASLKRKNLSPTSVATAIPSKSGSLATERILATQPNSVTTTLRDYQMVGVEWMISMHRRGLPMILGDEMGLGKTLQTISLIAYLKENGTVGPSLVICPLSVLYSWCNEIQKHAPSLKYFRLHSSDNVQRAQQIATVTKDALSYDIIVTTFEMAKTSQIQGITRKLKFNYCILDEGHVIKNIQTQVSEMVRKVHSQSKLILTGTPLQNNLVELFAILNYLYPELFTNPEPFAKCFNIGKNKVNPAMLLKANKMLNLFMLRRLKVEVEKLMPKKIEIKILCPLSSTQLFWYKGFLMNQIEGLIKANDEAASGNSNGGTKSKYQMLRNLVMQLRKCCLHPYLFDFAEPNPDTTGIEELVSTSGKLAVLDMILRSLFQKRSRTVLFSQFTSMLDILEDYCILRGWKYCRFDGSTPRAVRNSLIERFNKPGSEIFIFLMSTRAGGLGINLQTADTCILYDSDWNPQPDLQAMARVHRIGQKKTVHVYRLVSSGTIEERMIELAEKKLYLDQMVNGGGSTQAIDGKGGLTAEELLDTLRFGSNAVFSSANDLPTSDDILRLTDRNRNEDTATKSAKEYNAEKEMTDTMTLEGVDFRALRDGIANKEKGKKSGGHLYQLKQHWKGYNNDLSSMGKGMRERKSRIVNVYGKGSGYGSVSVPVLALNNYDLEKGEPTFCGKSIVKKSKAPDRNNQDFCQYCGDGGLLLLCPRCPISVHETCCGAGPKQFLQCSHHYCSKCNKNRSAAGGLLYPCQSCPLSFCEDCLPKDVYRFLGTSLPRFDALCHYGSSNYHYIHCSEQCEKVAMIEFGFKKPKPSDQECPPEFNLTYAFGANALSAQEIAKKHLESSMS